MSPRTFLEADQVLAGPTAQNFFQMPTPPTTQIYANGQGGDGIFPPTSDPEEWISLTPDGIHLTSHSDTTTPWLPWSYTGNPSTGWGSESIRAISYSQAVGSQTGFSYDQDGNMFTNVPSSTMSMGYTSFIFTEDTDLGDNQFFIQSPDWLMYVMPACANYRPEDAASSGQPFDPQKCPIRKMKKGEFKFSILGLMSGSNINSLNSAYPPSGTPGDMDVDAKDGVVIDIADYKTMTYRMTLDIGAMAGSDGMVNPDAAFIKSPNNATMNLADIPAGYNIAGHTLHIVGPKYGEVSIEMFPYYSVGRYTRDLSEAVCEPGEGGDFQSCTRDVSGYKNSPDSFPPRMSKYVGEKVGTPQDDNQDIRSMAGAPELVVGEVKEMNIQIKAATCTGRPDSPPWSSPPADCPWWYTEVCDDRWCVDCETIPHSGLNSCKDQQTLCESGLCYHIDFNVDLGGTTESERTLFGNPENDQAKGLERGVFFMYDPTLLSEGEESLFEKYFEVILACGALLLFSIIVCCCRCACKKCRKNPEVQDPKGVML
mmetsp:Transcript_10265/g.21099  ORF Transcript_10265/g.21099 Transcript_10265/m.21099 type:complete len:540 (+) Transcript_10265:43-1662(+)